MTVQQQSPSFNTLLPRASTTTATEKALRTFRAEYYPIYSVYLVVTLIFAVAIFNAASIIHRHLVLHRVRHVTSLDKDKESGDRASSRRGRVSLRRLPLAVISTLRMASYRVIVPFGARFPLVEVIVSLGYLLSMLVFCFANARNSSGVLDAQYWANRSGVLAVSHLTFIVALAGKNNIISSLTGIGYEKLNILHRAASRTLLLLIWVHMWGRWELGLTGKHTLHPGWMRAGLVAIVALTLAVILGTRQLRNKNYELFLAGHIILVFIFLLAGLFHVTYSEQFMSYMWPPFIAWGLDRTLRLARILRARYLSSKCKGSAAQAKLQVISANTLSVTIRLASSASMYSPLGFSWRAGQSACLSIPIVARWGSGLSSEAHPFTIASIDTPVPVSDAPVSDEKSGVTRSSDVDLVVEIKFIVRARHGFTRRLHAYALRNGGSCMVSAFVDGPYGEPPVIHTHPNAIFVAGGSGVSFTLPLMLDLVRQTKTSGTLCKRIAFVWLIREREHLKWINEELDEIKSSLPANIDVNIRIYITGKLDARAEMDVPTLKSSEMAEASASAITSAAASNEKLELDSPNTEGSSKATINDNFVMKFAHLRPSVAQLLEDEVSVCDGSVAVCVSGPQTLIDDVRAALSKPKIAGPMAVLRGGSSTFLHVEHFGM